MAEVIQSHTESWRNIAGAHNDDRLYSSQRGGPKHRAHRENGARSAVTYTKNMIVTDFHKVTAANKNK